MNLQGYLAEKESYLREKELEELKLSLEKQIAAAIWIQAIGKIAEAILVLKLLALGEDSAGEQTVATGVFVQMIGQIIEAIGVTKQVSIPTQEVLGEAQKIVVTGDWLQSLGAAIEATGGGIVIADEQMTLRPGFVP